jgi:hypothetical protein
MECPECGENRRSGRIKYNLKMNMPARLACLSTL